MIRKLLVYGGAFNPPHLGHERLLTAAIDALAPDLTLVIPSEVSPHKESAEVPFFDRLYLSRTFLGCGNHVRASGMEYTGRRCKSYTLRTIKRLRKRYPHAEIYLLIGSDMLDSIDTWKQYKRLLSMVTLAAAVRCDADRASIEADAVKAERLGGQVVLLEFEPLDISSTEIREQLAAGGTADGMVSDFVADYIYKRNLYR